MFSSDKKIAGIRELILELKQYFSLQLKYLRIDFVGKLVVLLSALILGAILFVLAAIIFLFASIAAGLALAPHVGGTAEAFAIIVLCYAALAFFIYWRRNPLIVAPHAPY